MRLGIILCMVAASLTLGSQQASATPARDMIAAVEAKFKLNPAPGEAYATTVKVEGAPGPFQKVAWYANYEAPNCTFKPDKFLGYTITPMKSVPVEFTRVDETTFAGTFFLDAMLDEDYLGKGVCNWQFKALTITLKATGAKEETQFFAGFADSDMAEKKPMTAYFWSGGYPRATIDEYWDYGFPNPDQFKPELRDELFKITTTFTKAGQ